MKEPKTDVNFARIRKVAKKFAVDFRNNIRIPQIAKNHGVSPPTVRKYLSAAGIHSKPHGWHLRHPHRTF